MNFPNINYTIILTSWVFKMIMNLKISHWLLKANLQL